jgi:hypothetical protein
VSPTVTAFFAANVTATAATDVQLTASDAASASATSRGVSVSGTVSVGLSYAEANLTPNVSAAVGTGATVDAGRNVGLVAQLTNGSATTSAASSAGGALVGGLSGSFGNTTATATVDAGIGASATVTAGNDITVNAQNTVNAQATGDGNAMGLIGGLGASIAYATDNSTTRAHADGGATLNANHNVVVTANASDNATTTAQAGSAGVGVGASGADARATVSPTVAALLAANVQATAGNDVQVSATAGAGATASANGLSLAAGPAAGVSYAEANLTPNVSATVGAGATVHAQHVVLVSAQLTNGSASATANGSAGSILQGNTGANAQATANGTVDAGIGSNATVTTPNDVMLTAQGGSSAQASANGASFGLGGLGISYVRATDTSATQAHVDASATVNPGGKLTVGAYANDSGSATAIASTGGLDTGNGADAAASVTPTVAASLAGSVQVNAGGDVQIDASGTSSVSALAQGSNISALHSGKSIAAATLTPSVTAAIGTGATVHASGSVLVRARGNVDALGNPLNNTASATAAASTGSLSGDIGAQATTTVGGTVDAGIGANATVQTTTGDITVTAQGSTDARASSTGIGVNFLSGSGSSNATVTDNSTTRAHVDGPATINPGRNLAVTASASDNGTATAQALTGGLTSGAGANASVTVTPTVQAVLAGGIIQVHAGNDVQVMATGAAGASATATGVSVGLQSAGSSLAAATALPAVSATVGANAVVAAGHAVLLAAQLSNDAARATATGSSAGAFLNGALISAISTATGTVNTGIGTGATVTTTTGDVALSAWGNNNAQASADGNGLGLASFGVSFARATDNSSTRAHLDGGTVNPGGNLTVAAGSSDNGSAFARAAGAGLAQGNGADAAASVTPTVQAFLAGGVQARAGNDVQVAANDWAGASATARGSGVGGANMGVSLANATFAPSVWAWIGSGATVNAGHAVGVTAQLGGGSANADASSSGGAALLDVNGASATATASGVVDASLGGNATVTSGTGDVAVTAQGSNSAVANGNGNGFGLAGFGASLASAYDNSSTTAHVDNGATVNAGHDLVVGATGFDSGSATATAGSAGLFSGSGALAYVSVTPTVQAYLDTGVQATAGNDVRVTATGAASAFASAQGSRVFSLLNGVKFGLSGATALLTPSVSAWVGANARVNAGNNVNVAAQLNFNGFGWPQGGTAVATATGSAGAVLAGVTGANATATASGITNAFLASNVTVTAGRDVSVTAQDLNDARANSAGNAAGFVSIGTSIASAYDNSVTKAHVDAGATINLSGNLTVSAAGFDSGDAVARAVTGGIISGNGAWAYTNVTPTVQAFLANNVQVVAGNAVGVLAQAEGHSHTNAQGVVAGVADLGDSLANANAAYVVSATVGDGDVLTAPSISVTSNFSNGGMVGLIPEATRAEANASAFGLTSGSVALSYATSSATVATRIGNARLTARNNVSLNATANHVVTGNADGRTNGLLLSGAGVWATIAATTSATTSVAGGAVVHSDGDVSISSSASTPVSSTVSGGAGNRLSDFLTNLFTGNWGNLFGNLPSIFSAGGCLATVTVSNNALTDVAAGARVEAVQGRADITSAGQVQVSTDTEMTSAGALAASATAVTDVAIDASAVTHLGTGAVVNARDVRIAADNQIGATAFASGVSNVDFAGAFANALTRLTVGANGPSLALVAVDGAQITGTNTVTLEATNHQAGPLLSNARSRGNSTLVLATATAYAVGSANVGSQITSGGGMQLTAGALYTHAESTYSLQRTPEARADTVITRTVEVLVQVTRNVTRTICSWAPEPLDEICTTVTDTVTEWVTQLVTEVIPSSTYTATGGSGLNIADAINLGGDVYHIGAASRQLTINADGSIDGSSNVGGHIVGNDFVVDDIVNDRVPHMQFWAPLGTVTGGAVLHLGAMIPSVTIINKSNYNLVLGQIAMIAGNLGDPELDYRWALLSPSHEYAVDGGPDHSTLFIHNLGSGDVAFTQSISNVAADFDVLNDGGAIVARNFGVVLQAGDAGYLNLAAHGDIGGPFGQRLGVSLVHAQVNPNGGAAVPVRLTAAAGGDILLDVTGINTYVDPNNQHPVISQIRLNVQAGGSADVQVSQSIAIAYVDGLPPAYTYCTGIYDFPQVSAGTGNVTVNVMAGDIGSGQFTAAGNAALTASGAIGGGTTVTAQTANLQAGNGVGSAATPVATVVGHLQAGGGNGGVWVSNSGDLIVDGVNAAGNVVVLVSKSGGQAGNLTLGNMAWVSSYSGSVTLRADHNLTVPSGSSVYAQGAATFQGGYQEQAGPGSTIEVSGWVQGTGNAILGGAGTDTLVVTADSDMALGDTYLTRSSYGYVNVSFTLTSLENALLTGGMSDNHFTVSDWTGTGTLDGGDTFGFGNSVVAVNDVNFTLSDTTLQRSGRPNLSLRNIHMAYLTGGASANTFTIQGWSGSDTLDGGAGADTYNITLSGSGFHNIQDSGTDAAVDAATVTNNAGGAPFTLSSMGLFRNMEGVNFNPNLEQLTVNNVLISQMYNGQSAIQAAPSMGTSLFVNGGTPGPTDDPVRQIQFNLYGIGGATLRITGPGSGVLSAPGFKSVTYTHFDRVTAMGGMLQVTMDANANPPAGNNANDGHAETFTVRANGPDLDLLYNGVLLFVGDPWTVGPINVTGSSDSDTLVLDHTFGVYNGMIFYDGVPGGTNTLVIMGSHGVPNYQPDPNVPGSGTVTTMDGPNMEVCHFVNLTPVIVHDVPGFVFRTPNSHNALTIDSPAAGQNRIGGTTGGVAFETATFYNVPDVTVDTGTNDNAQGDPNDSIAVAPAGLGASGLQILRLSTGAGSDTLTFQGISYALPAGGLVTSPGGLAVFTGAANGNSGLASTGPAGLPNPNSSPPVPLNGSVSLADLGALFGAGSDGLSPVIGSGASQPLNASDPSTEIGPSNLPGNAVVLGASPGPQEGDGPQYVSYLSDQPRPSTDLDGQKALTNPLPA